MSAALLKIPNVLTIAGSDSSGGAGVQADLKTFSALGCYGAAAITTLTAQNTHGVLDIFTPEARVLRHQLDAVLSDIHFDAVKIGALVNEDLVKEVARASRPQTVLRNVVLDPVMVSTSGHSLLDQSAVEAMKHKLLPLVDVLTPNLPEAAELIGGDASSIAENEEEMIQQGRIIADFDGVGKIAVLMKGGHLTSVTDESPDWLIYSATKTAHPPVRFSSQRVQARNTHGTGCTLSSAIAAHLAHGKEIEEAVEMAKLYVHDAIRAGQERLDVGSGPVASFAPVVVTFIWSELPLIELSLAPLFLILSCCSQYSGN